MARSYNVTSIEVLPKLDSLDDVVVKLNFTYGNSEAFLSGSFSLPAPEGTILPLKSITKEIALQWLLAHCPNTTEEFDAQLDREIAEKANEPSVYDWSEEPDPNQVIDDPEA